MQIKVMSRSTISLFKVRQHTIKGQMNFTTTLITVSTTRARASVRGLRGELARLQGEHEQQAQAGHHFPPAKHFGRPDAVQAQVVK
jgi:hypothetical protein